MKQMHGVAIRPFTTADSAQVDRESLKRELRMFERQFLALHGRQLRVKDDLYDNASRLVRGADVRSAWRKKYRLYFSLCKDA